MDLGDLLTEERHALADLLDTLTPEQWGVRTLCHAWDVHGLAAHLLVPTEFSTREMVTTLVRARGNADRVAVLMAARRAELPSSEIVRRLRAQATSRSAPPIVGLHGPYTDALVHGEDLRIPLGLTDDRPAERWRPVLDFLMSPRARVGFLARAKPALTYRATDLDWQHGAGDVVSGPAAALALALLGRTARHDQLTGPGKDSFAVGAAR